MSIFRFLFCALWLPLTFSVPAVHAATAQKPAPFIPARPLATTNTPGIQPAGGIATNRVATPAPATRVLPLPPATNRPGPAVAAPVRPPASTVASPNANRSVAPRPATVAPAPAASAPVAGGGMTNGAVRAVTTPPPASAPAPAPARPASWVPADFADLNFAPIPKKSYPNNPRRNVRALYVSINVLNARRFDDILDIARQTSVDGLVIDFKDDDGRLLVASAAAARFNPQANADSRPVNWPVILQKLRAMNLYLIARIVVFKDPIYAKAHPAVAILDNKTGRPFKSQDGLTWATPYNADFQAYNLALAEEAAALGFNEVQFDYIRFPDVPRAANLNFRTDIRQSKARVIQQFLLDARRRLEPRNVYLAADVFGLTCTVVDDMRIGQYWEGVANVVDYICPMMYPSHYGNGNYGLSVPDRFPYELIDRGTKDALRRNARLQYPADLRPWIQGFTASWVRGHITYGPPELKAQIRALGSHNVGSYLVWHPGGKYDLSAYR